MGIGVGDAGPAEAAPAGTLDGRPLPFMWRGIAAEAALRDSDTVEDATFRREISGG